MIHDPNGQAQKITYTVADSEGKLNASFEYVLRRVDCAEHV
jgi:hypothetical protein